MTSMVDQLEGRGFNRFHTGGNCWAMRYAPGDNSWEILITDNNLGFPERGDWLLCAYGTVEGQTVYAIDQDGAESLDHAMIDGMTAIYHDWLDHSEHRNDLSIDELAAELLQDLATVKDERGQQAGQLSADIDWLRSLSNHWERICF